MKGARSFLVGAIVGASCAYLLPAMLPAGESIDARAVVGMTAEQNRVSVKLDPSFRPEEIRVATRSASDGHSTAELRITYSWTPVADVSHERAIQEFRDGMPLRERRQMFWKPEDGDVEVSFP